MSNKPDDINPELEEETKSDDIAISSEFAKPIEVKPQTKINNRPRFPFVMIRTPTNTNTNTNENTTGGKKTKRRKRKTNKKRKKRKTLRLKYKKL